VLRASSLPTKSFGMFWNASTLPCSAVSSGDVDERPDAWNSVVALSTSVSRACRVPYEPSCMRLVIVVGPFGGASLARFESASPEEDRAIEEVMGWERMDGCVSQLVGVSMRT
jgi:hypothetical protein